LDILRGLLDLLADLICPLKSPFWRQFFPRRLAYISRVCLGGEERTATKIINFSVQSQVMQEVYLTIALAEKSLSLDDILSLCTGSSAG